MECGGSTFGLRRLDAALQHGGLTPLCDAVADTIDAKLSNDSHASFLFRSRQANLKSGVKPPQSKIGGGASVIVRLG